MIFVVLGRPASEATGRRQDDPRLCRVHARRGHFEDHRLLHRLPARGRANEIARGGKQVQSLLADAVLGVEGGGQGGTVPRPWHPTRPTDSQHSHHDGDIRGRRLRAVHEVQRNILSRRTRQLERKESVVEWLLEENLRTRFPFTRLS